MSTVWLSSIVLALATDPVPDAKDVRPGWIALVTVVSLCAASLFLWFSMRKQIGRIQVPREDEQPEGPTGATGPTREPSDAQDA